MKNIALIMLLLLAYSCAATEEIHEKNLFSFTLDGENYQIISMNMKSGEGGNLLVLREGNRISLSAQDLNQDGLIDTILKGDINIEKANVIYREGIRIARNRGLYKEKEGLRTFEWKTETINFIIQSFAQPDDIYFNRFSVYLPGRDIIGIDRNADGIIDEIEKGELEIEKMQQLYDEALEIGIRVQRIMLLNKHFIVSEQNPNL